MKIFIAYLVICFYYSACRMHYLITIKEDEEFNDLYEQVVSFIGRKKTVILVVTLQMFLSPVLAPFSMLKRIISIFIPKKKKDDK